MAEKKLSQSEIIARLKELEGWEYNDNSLIKEFHFKDFGEAFGFMTTMAAEAERLNHHPDWRNEYNKVTIGLITHDAGGVTNMDFRFARKANQAAEDFYT